VVETTEREADRAGRIGRNRAPGPLGGGETTLATKGEHTSDDVGVEPHRFALRGDETAGPQRVLHRHVERLLEEDLGWTDWIGRVDDDDVESAPLLSGHVGGAVADVQRDARVVEAAGERGQNRLATSTTFASSSQMTILSDALVARNFAQTAAVAAANDEDALGRAVSKHRNVSEHFLIGELVALRHLHDAVEHEHAPCDAESNTRMSWKSLFSWNRMRSTRSARAWPCHSGPIS
jgi:hypothetical protein